MKPRIELANVTRFALGAAVFTEDIRKMYWTAEKIDAGTVWMNYATQSTSKRPLEATATMLLAVRTSAKAMVLFYEYPELNFGNVFSVPLPEKRVKTGFVAVPPTSGTASEVTHVTVITFPELGQKLTIKTKALRADVAILNGRIFRPLPAHIAAETGMDALTHAIECYTNRSKETFTDLLMRGAIEGIFAWLPRSVFEGDLESRQKMHEYSCMAGIAFSNAGLGMVHGISHAFSAHYNTAHRLANAVILPYVLDFSRRDP